MITHFLYRDFITHRFHWLLLILFSFFVLPSIVAAKGMFYLLIYVYSLFAVTPIYHLTGVTFRSQHIMSRNYILSLPVKRKKLFLITQLRAFIFWIPFLLVVCLFPWINQRLFLISTEVPLFNSLLFYPTVLSGVFWGINSIVMMQLSTEKISTFVTSQERAKAWIVLIAIYVLESAIVLSCFFLPALTPIYIHPLLGFIIVSLFGMLRFFWCRTRWLSM